MFEELRKARKGKRNETKTTVLKFECFTFVAWMWGTMQQIDRKTTKGFNFKLKQKTKKTNEKTKLFCKKKKKQWKYHTHMRGIHILNIVIIAEY